MFGGYNYKFKSVFLLCVGLSLVLEALKLKSCEQLMLTKFRFFLNIGVSRNLWSPFSYIVYRKSNVS
jgi:hypothetical protein